MRTENTEWDGRARGSGADPGDDRAVADHERALRAAGARRQFPSLGLVEVREPSVRQAPANLGRCVVGGGGGLDELGEVGDVCGGFGHGPIQTLRLDRLAIARSQVSTASSPT